MSATYTKTIVVKGQGTRFESLASGAIYPGMLVELLAATTVRAHSTAQGFAEKAFAVEDELQGRGIDTVYASGSVLQYNIMEPGSVVNALIQDAANITFGDKLVSAGDGTLIKYVAQSIVDTIDGAGDSSTDPGGTVSTTAVVTQRIVAVAMEDCNMSGSSLVDPAGPGLTGRCLVRIV